MKIPYSQLSTEALENVVKEYVLREGTDYGLREWTLEEKIEQVLRQVKANEASIVFDQSSESFTIIKTD